MINQDDCKPCCDKCMLYVNETCTTVRRQLCDDYRAIPYISEEERKGWPLYGDASCYRMLLWSYVNDTI